MTDTVPRIYHRDQWGARAPKCATPRALTDIRTVYVHYSDTAEGIPAPSHAHDVVVVQAIQRDHMDNRGYCDIAYAALIGGNGDVYLGRPNNVVQAAVYGHNHDEWSVCFLTNGAVTDAAWHSFRVLLAFAIAGFPLVSRHPQPHSAATATACPGDAIRARLATLPK